MTDNPETQPIPPEDEGSFESLLDDVAEAQATAIEQEHGAPPRRPLAELQTTIGYTMQNEELLHKSLVHKSYLHEVPDSPLGSNERLEFLGDAVLGLIVSTDLFLSYPDVPEGQLSALRGALVRLNTLAELAEPLHLGEYLYMSHGEEAAGGRTRHSNMGRAVEAILGAVYLDGGLQAAHTAWHHILGDTGLERLKEVLSTDYKSQLQQLTQAHMKETPHYRLVETMGPDHAKEFRVEVVVGGRALASGIGRNKQTAEQAAAHDALRLLLAEAEAASVESLAAEHSAPEESGSVEPGPGELDSGEQTPDEAVEDGSPESAG